MRLLSTKQTLLFAKGGNGGEHVTVTPKPGIQEVPDWIRETGTFELALSKGVIVDLDNLGAQRPAPEAVSVTAAPVEDKLPGLGGSKIGGKARAA